MKTNKIILFSVVAISFFSILFFNPINIVRAQSLWEQQKDWASPVSNKFNQPGTNPIDPRDITINVIKVFLTFMSIIFIILIILAGYKWMTAAGNEQKAEEAKSQILTSTIGMVIILSAYIITSFVASRFDQSLSGSIWQRF
jgi:hypothetical protein